MRVVWGPKIPPPSPSSVSGLSADAEKVWAALQEKFRRWEQRETKNDPKQYYRSLYAKRFGDTTFLYSSQTGTSTMAQQAYVKDTYATQQGYDKDGYHQDNRSEAPGIPTYQPHLPRMTTTEQYPGLGQNFGPTMATPSPTARWIRMPGTVEQPPPPHMSSGYPDSGVFKTPDLPRQNRTVNLHPVDNLRDTNNVDISRAPERTGNYSTRQIVTDRQPEKMPHSDANYVNNYPDPFLQESNPVVQSKTHAYRGENQPVSFSDFDLKCTASSALDSDVPVSGQADIVVEHDASSISSSPTTKCVESTSNGDYQFGQTGVIGMLVNRHPDDLPASQVPLFDPTQPSQVSTQGTLDSQMSCSPPLDLSQESFQMEWQRAHRAETKLAAENESSGELLSISTMEDSGQLTEVYTDPDMPTSAQPDKTKPESSCFPEDDAQRLNDIAPPDQCRAADVVMNNETDTSDIIPSYSNGNDITSDEDTGIYELPGNDHQSFGQSISRNIIYAAPDPPHHDVYDIGSISGSLPLAQESSRFHTPNKPLVAQLPISSLTKRLQEIPWDHPNKKPKIMDESPAAGLQGHANDTEESFQNHGKSGMDESPYPDPIRTGKQTKKKGKPQMDKENGNFALRMKPVFKAPSKKTTSVSTAIQPEVCDRLLNVFHLKDSELHQLSKVLLQANEVAVTLVYGDNTSQLSLNKAMKKKCNPYGNKVVAVAAAFPVPQEEPGIPASLKFILMPHDETCHKWKSDTLNYLIGGKTRLLGFRLQDFLIEVITHYDVAPAQVSCGNLNLVDAAIAAWLLNPDNPPTTMSDCFRFAYGLKQTSSDNGWQSQLCDDLSVVGPLMVQLSSQLRQRDLWDIYTSVEMPLCPLLAVMDLTGLRVEGKKLHRAGDRLKRKLSQLEKAAHQAAGRTFLVNSHVQLREVLFEELKLDQRLLTKAKIAKTSSGKQKSTSESVLQQLSETHPLPDIILEHRQLQKLKSTYVDGMLAHVHDGQLFTHWDQTAAATGRLTSTNPNIQAIPKQAVILAKIQPTLSQPGTSTDEKIYAREAFVSREGHRLMTADFQQIELRVLAHLSGDPCILSVFNSAQCQDIFVELTSQWLGKNSDEVSSADREQTKRIVYSVMYGAGKERLSEYLKISAEEAKNIMDSFLVRFPGINAFARRCIDEARSKGYLCTLFRRRRLFPNIRHPNPQLRAYSERQAVNFCVQGSAADLCKAAMIQVERALRTKDLKARLLAQIHDELLLEVPEAEVETVAGLLVSIMESGSGLCGPNIQLRVPLKVSVYVGTSWAHMEKHTAVCTPEMPVNEP